MKAERIASEMILREDEKLGEVELVSPEVAGAEEADDETSAATGLVPRSGPSTHYRPDVDGLRAVAVIAVVLFHFDESWVPGGFVGVDIFFVISGYVVSGSLLRERHTSSGAFIAAFYARRVKRLMPALYTVVLATSWFMATRGRPVVTAGAGSQAPGLSKLSCIQQYIFTF